MLTFREQMQTELQNEALYWSAYLQDFDVKSVLPFDHPSYGAQGFEPQTFSFALSSELSQRYYENAEKTGVSLENFVYAAWAILLQKYNNSEDTLFGTPNAEGAFLPLRSKASAGQTVGEFVLSVAQNLEERRAYEGTPLETIARCSELDHTQPLFDSIVTLHPKEMNAGHTPFSLEVTYTLPFEFSVTYNRLLFNEATVQRMAGHFERAVVQMIEFPEMLLADIDILSEEEKDQVLNQFNCLTVEYDRTMTVDGFFEAQVQKSPTATAVICGDRQLTYEELNAQANRLARVLRSKGVGPEQLVGLIVERDLELIIGMLGIMKAGAAYLPVDPAFPRDRISYMFGNGNVNLLLTSSELNMELTHPCEQLHLDKLDLSAGDSSALDKLHTVNNLMYVLYTSGSTGQPKGVAVEHRNVAGYVHAFKNEFPITANDRMIQQSTVSFDISVEEIYPILLTGGTLIIAKRHEVAHIPTLVEVMQKHGATMISGFPLLLNELNKHEVPDSLHTLISGGDVLREEYVTNLIKKAKVYNTYGPSETTVCINYFQFTGECESSIPTGRTIANYKVYILDRNRKPVPIGVPGEVCIGGVGVSREYLNRPDITSERYIPNPFHPEETMFTCGDLARWLPDGNVEFLGRMDDQVKIRGRRTEPGEIQRILMKHETVKEAFVMARTDKYKHKYLTAYVSGDELLSAADLKAHLAKHLPDFMVPPYFVQLEKLPLTPNGKVDKKALPHVID